MLDEEIKSRDYCNMSPFKKQLKEGLGGSDFNDVINY